MSKVWAVAGCDLKGTMREYDIVISAERFIDDVLPLYAGADVEPLVYWRGRAVDLARDDDGIYAVWCDGWRGDDDPSVVEPEPVHDDDFVVVDLQIDAVPKTNRKLIVALEALKV